MKKQVMELRRKIQAGQGKIPCDLVIRNVRIFHLNTGEFEHGDIGILGDVIVGISTKGEYRGKTELDGKGLTAVPGFIDAHVHVESSMIRPYEFERNVLPHGVTTAFCDPHEFANVVGTAAFDYFLACAKRMKMSLRVHLSSCVPATPFETSGAVITASDIEKYAGRENVCGLAEVMNVPAVLNGDEEILRKIVALQDGVIDGHAPCVSGLALNAYAAAGITNDHECNTLAEAREKLNRGMNVLIREGSVAQDLNALTPLLTLNNSMSLCFCTDDRNPLDIREEGHIDGMIRRVIAKGIEPLAAYRAASWSTARIFGLRDYGLIAPGYKADIVLLSNFKSCRIKHVVKHGEIVNDALFASRPSEPSVAAFRKTVKCRKVTAKSFAKPMEKGIMARVIGIRPMSLITDDLKVKMPFAKNDDIVKIAVLERHGKNGNIAVGWVKGSGITNGAIASSVGHDSHNICAIGSDDEQIATAVNQLIAQQGGFVVVSDNRVLATLPLTIGGLMSEGKLDDVESALKTLRKCAKKTGCTLGEPFLQLAFLPLPVIPALKITDRGVIQTSDMTFV